MNDIVEYINKIGETNINSAGSTMTIIGFRNQRDIDIKFDNGYVAYHKRYDVFKNGQILSPYCRTVCGVGYLGEGKYQRFKQDMYKQPVYIRWCSLLSRIYNQKEKNKKRNISYQQCSVCEEWLNFNNFATWFDANYYEIPGERMCLDKDILRKGNKIYSPETCIYVPENINLLFLQNKYRRDILPIGVRYRPQKNNKNYTGVMQKQGHNTSIGTFYTPEEAFMAYKKLKEEYIKQVADSYKDKIPEQLYKALYEYQVDITD